MSRKALPAKAVYMRTEFKLVLVYRAANLQTWLGDFCWTVIMHMCEVGFIKYCCI